MSLSASRLVGAALLVAGITVSLWLALGVPQEWTGGMRWAGGALRLTSLGAIVLGACFLYPDRATRTPDGASHGADAGTPDGPDGSRV
ncbi:hypothetical protein [Streptomyces stelliscabiei]|uniref:Uncharacterized protein YjeT (DUF2065 family) n=1 Tax=Streptomyces stelliscabiei TaxID=146820 RepID=A0A8I0TRU8_9ACTN|nr:hypothetical protein [Streptomyces stelliscabiei]KND34997.1 hypothetical protein IQ64_39400 [Streptomyces stelliscabiei]MBE1599405.1 uncharacterized protein YjeT (DUF2065 family) [Streptomyces stelliscabiei]MDX2520841.1 hypothetical protein [Streptomyces stelliscabiei]MDX2554016.1 hypothetical protein [Streptomyces stelliscabiei]MDX2612759.1 hypothetical protein [Streptomyces stelliscabiei]